MMNKMNMKFHKICTIVKEISVHNGNTYVHQALFSDSKASFKKKKKNKLTWVTEYMYEVELLDHFSSMILQNVCPDRQCRLISDCTDSTVWCWIYTIR